MTNIAVISVLSVFSSEPKNWQAGDKIYAEYGEHALRCMFMH